MRRLRAVWFALALIPLGGWEPLWQNDADVDAGNRAYAEGRYDDALAAYRRARDNGVDSAGLAYDEGTATMAKGDQVADAAGKEALYDEAWQQLGKATHGKDKSLAARAHYNRGNIRMKQKKLDEAIDAYKDALRADPTLESARSNLELALRQREKQRQQQQGQGQGQQQPQQGQGQQQQPQQGQGQGQGQPQPPQQGQGQGQPQPQQPPQGQGQGQPQQPPQPQQGQGQPGQQPPQPGQGQQPPPRQMPQAQWPQDDTEGDTPDLPQGQKLDQLENMSRQLRRSRVRDGGDPSGAQPAQDW